MPMILSKLPFPPCLFRAETGLDQTVTHKLKPYLSMVPIHAMFEPASMELKIRLVDATAYEIQSDQDHCLTLF